MHIATELDQLRKAFPACRALAYADLRAQMIMVTSSGAAIPQERWDELCVNGIVLLSGGPQNSAAPTLDGSGGIATSIVFAYGELAVFQKSTVQSEDAIFCVAAPTLPIERYLDSAGDLLSRIALDD